MFYQRAVLAICAFAFITLTFAACRVPAGNSTPPPTPDETNQTRDIWYSVYFTDPENPTSKTYRGGPDARLAEAIRQSRVSVDVAVHDLNLWSIRDALLEAKRRGLTVRMVTESDNLDEDEIQQLKEAGIPVLGDRREGLMHNKFVVLDRREVWSGSMNLTVSESYRNNNNLLRIRSTLLAEDYTVEFEEMFENDLFGPGSPANTPHPNIQVDGTQVEVYFSPDDGAASRLAELLSEAQESIYFLAFSFTSDDLANAILERAKAGLTVAGVMEQDQVESNIGSDYVLFRQSGLDVRLDANPDQMHHKVMVIDSKIVVTGSYNFTSSAENRNDENLLVIHNGDVATLYLEEFQRLYEEAEK